MVALSSYGPTLTVKKKNLEYRWTFKNNVAVMLNAHSIAQKLLINVFGWEWPGWKRSYSTQ